MYGSFGAIMGSFFYFDYWYVVLVLPAIILAMIAQGVVNSRFKKYSQIRSYRGLTGAQAAEQVLRTNGVHNVRVETVAGTLSDHYDPRTNVIRLSKDVHDSVSIAAVGIAAHEAGHAVQYAQGYVPVRLRQAIIPVTQIGSSLSMPLVLIGIIFDSSFGDSLFLLGIAFFGLATVFQLVTLPVEFNASRNAMSTLEGARILDDEELTGAKKVLWAAAMTYVAGLAVSLAQMLRLLLNFSRWRRN